MAKVIDYSVASPNGDIAKLDSSGALVGADGGIILKVDSQLPGSLSSIASFSPTRIGIHRVTLSHGLSVLASDCSDLVAVQDGDLIPCEVAPWSSNTGSAVAFVRTLSMSAVTLGKSATYGVAQNHGGAYFKGAYIPTTATTFSASHSAAGASNPITSFVHPSIVDCGASWNGARYWATVTPWGGTGWPAADRYEDPCLFNSADAATWSAVNVNASGYANIDSAYVATSGVYSNSDARLVFDPLGNSGAGVLYCYFRRYGGSGSPTEAIFRCQSTNGTTWTDSAGTTGAFDAVKLNGAATFSVTGSLSTLTNMMSPSVVLRGGVWFMWGHRQLASDSTMRVRYFISYDGLGFTGGDDLDAWWPENYNGPWHSDVQFDVDSGQFVMIHPLSCKTEQDASTKSSSAYISTSTDGINWTLQPVPMLWQGLEFNGTAGATSYSYKGALCRVGTRSWLVAGSGTLLADATKRAYISPAQTIDFGTINPCRPVTAVFMGRGMRAYGDVADVAQYGYLQYDPPIKKSTVGTASIVGGALNVLRVGGASGNAHTGQKLGANYVLEAYLALATLTSRFILGQEQPQTGQAACCQYHWSGGTELRAQSNDAGVPYSVGDTNYHLWRVQRQSNVIAISVDDVQQHSYTTTESSLTGQIGFAGSGSVSGTDGIKVKAAYCYDVDCPMVSL